MDSAQHVFAIVRMIRRAKSIEANPYARAGMTLEDSVVYRVTLQERMDRMDPQLQRALHMIAEGITMRDAASASGLSVRTMCRMIERVEGKHAAQA